MRYVPSSPAQGRKDVRRMTELERLSEELRRAGADAALLSSFEDVCYTTGFEVPPPIDAGAAFAYGPTLAVATAAGGAVLLAPGAYLARAEETSRADQDVIVPGFGHFEAVDGRAEFLGAVETALRDAGLGGGGRLAVDARTLPAETARMLGRKFPEVEVLDARPIVAEARKLKTDREIELIRAAVALADEGQEALLELARPGRNELDVMGDIMTRVDRKAGTPVPWAGELVTGPRTGVVRYPGGPIDCELRAGDTALMDLSVRFHGYWADCCNVLAVGAEPTAEQLKYFRAARDAFEAAVGELRPGRRACDAHAAAAAAFVRHGLAPAHYTGHQIGATVNEDPRLVPYDETPIEAGMVFAVEPGAYGGEAAGTGARCEKVVLVTEDGPEILSRFRWGMEG
jgi:Xaa-Pro dipeptidase